MKAQYTGNYRTSLSATEKKEFRTLALQEGTVVDVHDRLIREFIFLKKQKQEAIDGSSDS